MIDSQLIQTIGLVLIHFIWQGLLIGMLFAAGRLAMQGASAVARYNWAVTCLLILALTPLLTLAWLSIGSSSPEASGLAFMQEGFQAGAASSVSSSSSWALSTFLPLIVGVWLCGVALMSVRLGAGWWHVRQLRCCADFRVPPHVRLHLEELSVRLNMSRQISLAFSARIAGPMLVGVFRPMILLPAGLLNRLSTRELEMVLAHELAHLQRADHLVNLFQNIVEILLYYHPVVRWISNVIRAERELASDECAASLTGDSIGYAETLLKLEKTRGDRLLPAIGMADHQVVTRVRNLLAPRPRQTGSIISGMALLSLVLISVVVGLVSTGLKALSEQDPAPTVQPSPIVEEAPALPAPVNESASVDVAYPDSVVEYDGLPQLRVEPVTPAQSESRDQDPGAERAVPARPVDPEPDTVLLPETPASSEPHPDARVVDESSVDLSPALEVVADIPGYEPADVADSAAMEASHIDEVIETGPVLAALDSTPVAGIGAIPSTPSAVPPPIRGGDVLARPAPVYPSSAARQRQEGRAEVRLTVDREGRVIEAVLIEESPRGYGFGDAAVRAAEQWQFEPFTRNGDPVRHEFQTGFDFTDPPACGQVTGTRIARC